MDVATELHFSRAEAARESDLRAFFFAAHGLELRVLTKRFGATVVDDARGCADLGVAERRDVLLDEVDEAAFTLEKREELEGGRRRRCGYERGRGYEGRRGKLSHAPSARREARVVEDAEVTEPGEPESREEWERGFGHGASVLEDRAIARGERVYAPTVFG